MSHDTEAPHVTGKADWFVVDDLRSAVISTAKVHTYFTGQLHMLTKPKVYELYLVTARCDKQGILELKY
jgi:hypothetical protein